MTRHVSIANTTSDTAPKSDKHHGGRRWLTMKSIGQTINAMASPGLARLRCPWAAPTLLTTALVAAALGCAHGSRAPARRRDQKVDEINEASDSERRASTLAATKAIADLDTFHEQNQIPLQEDGKPRKAVALDEDIASCGAACRALEADRRHIGPLSPKDAAAVSACWNPCLSTYFGKLRAVYWAADIGGQLTLVQNSGGRLDLETQLAADHNTRLASAVAVKKAEVEEALRLALRSIDDRKNGELEREEAELQRQQEERQRRRRAIAAALQGLGQAMQSSAAVRTQGATPGGMAQTNVAPIDTSPTHYGASPSFSRSQPPGCSSDFACGFGHVCVKPNFSATGTCMRSVDSLGLQQMNPPRSSSVGVKTPSPKDCHFDTDCGIGFRCDTASGACLR